MINIKRALEIVIELAAQNVDEEQGENRDEQESACDTVEALATALFGNDWRQDPYTPSYGPSQPALNSARNQIESYMRDLNP